MRCRLPRIPFFCEPSAALGSLCASSSCAEGASQLQGESGHAGAASTGAEAQASILAPCFSAWKEFHEAMGLVLAWPLPAANLAPVLWAPRLECG